MGRITATLLIGVALGIGIALVAGGQPTTSGAGFVELHRGDVVGTDDVEVVMGIIERTNESKTGKHYHP